MTTGGFLLLILLSIAGLMAWKMARRSRARTAERHWLPRELQHAQLAFAEKTFKTWRPIGLIARADRGYWLNGQLHLAEFKTRMPPISRLATAQGGRRIASRRPSPSIWPCVFSNLRRLLGQPCSPL